jgi:hypothetical protein
MNEVSRRVRAAEAAFAPVADFYFRVDPTEDKFDAPPARWANLLRFTRRTDPGP